MSLAISILLICACTQKNDIEKKVDTPKENNTVEITPFVINEVVLNDTTKVLASTSGFTKEGKWFPTETSFGYNKTYSPMASGQVKVLMEYLRRSSKLKVYLDIDSLPLSTRQMYMYLNGCDSVVEYDDKGKAKGPRHLMCDSTSMYDQIKKILFYESWALNKESGSIEKTVLGYSFFSYMENKNQYRLMYHIFSDDASLAIAKKYLSIQVKEISK